MLTSPFSSWGFSINRLGSSPHPTSFWSAAWELLFSLTLRIWGEYMILDNLFKSTICYPIYLEVYCHTGKPFVYWNVEVFGSLLSFILVSGSSGYKNHIFGRIICFQSLLDVEFYWISLRLIVALEIIIFLLLVFGFRLMYLPSKPLLLSLFAEISSLVVGICGMLPILKSNCGVKLQY